jgi:class 3 adenylate cyclase
MGPIHGSILEGVRWRKISAVFFSRLFARSSGPEPDWPPLLWFRPAPPEGLLALMVTDIEGFTTLVEQLGDARSQSIIREHNRMLRTCIKARMGVEIDHTGDGILAAFRSVTAALQCASDIQQAIGALAEDRPGVPLRVRIAVHAGEPLPEEERLFGHCVNVAMRVCAQTAAGSVLVTLVVKQLAQGRFLFGPEQAHKLKGMTEPVTLCEFAWTQCRVDPPALAQLSA